MSEPTDKKQQAYIDAYTRQNRAHLKRDVIKEKSGLQKLGAALETANRKLWYGALNAIINNPPLTQPLELSALKSILVVPYGDAIGDMIAATPIWRAIKKRNPSCHIGVISSYRNTSLIAHDPDVDEQYFFTGRKDREHYSELRKARTRKYEVILNLHFSRQTDYGFICNYIGPRSIKITGSHPRADLYRTFFNHIGTRPRYTSSLPLLSLELLAEAVHFDPPLVFEESFPSLAIPIEYHQKIRERIHALTDAKRYIVLNTQGANALREWGLENSLQFAQELTKKYTDLAVLLTASPSAFAGVEKAASAIGNERIQSFSTSYDLLELAALVQGASLVVTPDTSLTHFASATHTPVITLFPDRTRMPIEWLPFATPARFTAPAEPSNGVATISIEEVLQMASTLLEKQWTQTQTSFDISTPPHPLYQRENAKQLLVHFRDAVLTFYS